jgi:hypothetical protein
MAKKSAATPAPEDIQELPPAMDYAQHEATWKAVTAMIKWSIIALGVICIALYFFIEAGQPVIGTLLLMLLPAGAVWLAVTRSRSMT